jgi:hypothetical protein
MRFRCSDDINGLKLLKAHDVPARAEGDRAKSRPAPASSISDGVLDIRLEINHVRLAFEGKAD